MPQQVKLTKLLKLDEGSNESKEDAVTVIKQETVLMPKIEKAVEKVPLKELKTGTFFDEPKEVIYVEPEQKAHVSHQVTQSEMAQTVKPQQSRKVIKPTHPTCKPFKISQEFISHVNEYPPQENGRIPKRIVLEEALHEQLMLLKHHTKVKSVEALVNVILIDFMNNNKTELQDLFAASTNRFNL